MAACVPDADIIFLSCFHLSFFFSSPNLRSHRLDAYHTCCGLSANLEGRSEMCCTRLAGNAGPKKMSKIRHLGTIAQLCRAVFATKACIDNPKKLVKQQCLPHMCSQYGELRPTSRCWRDWATPATFNGFRVLAALLHGTQVVGVSQSLWC